MRRYTPASSPRLEASNTCPPVSTAMSRRSRSLVGPKLTAYTVIPSSRQARMGSVWAKILSLNSGCGLPECWAYGKFSPSDRMMMALRPRAPANSRTARVRLAYSSV